MAMADSLPEDFVLTFINYFGGGKIGYLDLYLQKFNIYNIIVLFLHYCVIV